eukprot:1361634-Amorphochlora_amoeboformis.AAC.1
MLRTSKPLVFNDKDDVQEGELTAWTSRTAVEGCSAGEGAGQARDVEGQRQRMLRFDDGM